jgi:hypothetical protein
LLGWRSHVETVTVAAARSSSFAFSGTTLMVVSVVIVAAVAFAVVSGLKYFRNRTERGA